MYAGKRPDPMDSRRILEAVFQTELSRMFFDDFRPVPTGKYRQLAGIHRKKSEKLPVEILLPFPKDFRCFPAGYGGRNLRPGCSYQIEDMLLFWVHLFCDARFYDRTVSFSVIKHFGIRK
jgi:hypothetical protein